MKQLLAIARRETATFFHSAIAPVVLLGFLLLVGLFFTLFVFGFSQVCLQAVKSGHVSANLNLAEAVFQPLVADMAIFLLFLLPAVGMRLFAEEYRSGRYDLVMSYPVSDEIWVAGKWLSVMAATGVLLLTASLYFVITAWLGHPEPGPLLAAALGLMLLGGVIAVWSLFFSTLFQYQVVSYFLAFAFCLLLYSIDGLAPYLPGGLERVVTELSFRVHFVRFSWGVVDVKDIVFFLGWIALGTSAATASLTGRRLAVRHRFTQWLPTVVLAALVTVVYLVVQHYPLSWDWTGNKRYSLAPQSEQVLASLDQDIEITAFYQRLDPQRKAVEVLLRAFSDHSSHVRSTLVDPDRELSKVEEYGVQAARTVVISLGDRRKVLLEPDEGPLINAIYRLATGSRPVIYEVMGHGEHRLDSSERGGYSAYAQVLADQGYALQPLFMADEPLVPADADILVLAAPKLEYSEAEISALQDFVERGGAVLALLDPGTPQSLRGWTAGYNVGLGNDFIVSADPARRQFGADPRVVVIYDTSDYAEHPATRGLPGVATWFPFTQSLNRIHAGLRGVQGEWLLRTGIQSWAEKNPSTIASGKPEFEPDVDQPGPVVFGVALEVNRREFFGGGEAAEAGPRAAAPDIPNDPVLRTLQMMREGEAAPAKPSIFAEEATSRIIVLGDSDFAANANLNLYGNRDLLLNLLGWLARERVLIERRAVERIGKPLLLSVGQKETIGWLSMLAWPLLVSTVAVILVVRHRRQR